MLTKTLSPAPPQRTPRQRAGKQRVTTWQRRREDWRNGGKAAIGFAALAICSLASSALAPAAATAQQVQSSGQPGYKVAAIDIAFIFKNLPSIKAQVSKVEGDLKNYDAEFKQKRENLQQSIAQLKTLKVGTAGYAKLEERVAGMESNLRLEVTRTQKKISETQAKIYYDNYLRIVAAVRAIATHNDIKLVLRYNSESIDRKQTDLIARGVMRNVVYCDSTIDMTPAVMKYLEQAKSTTQVATGGDTVPPQTR